MPPASPEKSNGCSRDLPARRNLEARARAVYDAHFSVDRLIHTLRAA